MMLRSRSLMVLGVVVLAACGGAAATPPPKAPAPAEAAKAAKPTAPSPAAGAESIDRALRAAWLKESLTPAPKADDATFVRRVYLDVVGTIPTPDQASAFLASTDPDKRKKLVDALIASPAYAEHWMNYWDDVLMGREIKGPVVDRVAFRYWLRGRFASNTPWNRIVNDLVSATGQNSAGGKRMKLPQAMAATTNEIPLGSEVPANDEESAELDKVNGAVNWTLRFQQAPQDLAGNASRIFLGVQIQCAQCHDHKTETWKQEDYRKFASAFLHLRLEPIDKGKPMGNLRRVDIVDFAKVQPRLAKNPEIAPIAAVKATALDGTDLEKGENTRKALATWMTSKENPWFAKAFVNRMWGHFLGRGFYDPVDDMRQVNTPALPELLDRIAADFVAHDFDVAYLVREITSTEAYQLAASKEAKTDAENTLWARFHLVPLGPEELLNAILRVTDLENTAKKYGIENMDALRAQLVRQYAFLFDTDEADDVPDYSGTVTQALSLLNGQLIGQGTRDIPGSALDDILGKPGDDAAHVDALTLRVLSRKPTDAEKGKWVEYVQTATKAGAAGKASPKSAGPLGKIGKKTPAVTAQHAAYEDVMWAMLNSSEFTFNH